MDLAKIQEMMKNPTQKNNNTLNQVKALTFGKSEEQQKQMFYDMCKKQGLNPDNLIAQANKLGLK